MTFNIYIFLDFLFNFEELFVSVFEVFLSCKALE